MMFYNMFLGKINKFMYMHTHNRTCAEDDDVMSAPMSRFFFLGKIILIVCWEIFLRKMMNFHKQ